VRHGHGQRTVLAGDHGQPLVGFRRGGRESGIDHRDRRLVTHLPPDADRVGHLPVGCERVRAPAQHVSRVLEIVVAVVPESFREERAELLRLRADRRVADAVGRSEDLRQGGVDDVAHVAVSAAEQHELVRLVVGPQRHHLVGDEADGFVPGDGDEAGVLIPALLRIGALHGHLDPIGVVQLLQRHVRTRADPAVIGETVRVPAHAHGPSVQNAHLDGTPTRASLAGRRHPSAQRGRLAFGRRRHEKVTKERSAAPSCGEQAGAGRRAEERPSGETVHLARGTRRDRRHLPVS